MEDGFWIYYNPPGFIKEEGHYKGGKKDGLWKIMEGGYTPYLSEHINYKDGKKDGKNYEWYPTGIPKKEASYKDGVLVFEKHFDQQHIHY